MRVISVKMMMETRKKKKHQIKSLLCMYMLIKKDETIEKRIAISAQSVVIYSKVNLIETFTDWLMVIKSTDIHFVKL